MTALPRSPGWGPRLYHPTSSQGLRVGVARSPSDRTPTDSMRALMPMAEITRRSGMTRVGVIGRAALFPACIAGTPGVAVLAWLACFGAGAVLETAGLLHAASRSI